MNLQLLFLRRNREVVIVQVWAVRIWFALSLIYNESVIVLFVDVVKGRQEKWAKYCIQHIINWI